MNHKVLDHIFNRFTSNHLPTPRPQKVLLDFFKMFILINSPHWSQSAKWYFLTSLLLTTLPHGPQVSTSYIQTGLLFTTSPQEPQSFKASFSNLYFYNLPTPTSRYYLMFSRCLFSSTPHIDHRVLNDIFNKFTFDHHPTWTTRYYIIYSNRITFHQLPT